jgi:hypothetical protein
LLIGFNVKEERKLEGGLKMEEIRIVEEGEQNHKGEKVYIRERIIGNLVKEGTKGKEGME